MRFYFRLEAGDGSGHFRQGTIHSESEDEARAALERHELGNAGYRLDTEELAALEQAEADAAEAGGRLDDQGRLKLALHRQAEPYELAYLGNTEQPRDPKRKPSAGKEA